MTHCFQTLLSNLSCAATPGESICYQGNEMTAMFLVLKGRVEVWRKVGRCRLPLSNPR